MLDLSFVASDELEPLLEPLDDWSLEELDGVLAEPPEDDWSLEELDGVLVEPEPAEPLMLPELDDELGVDEEPLPDLLRSAEVEDELEPDGELLGDEVVPPADDEDDEPEGELVAPEGALLERALEPVSLARSHAAISEAPNARETATAIVESLMRPPWLGYRYWGARIGPGVLNG